MTLHQAAERLNCSTKTVRRRIAAGELRASHLGRGLWEIRDEDLDAYLDARANRPREIAPIQPATPVTPRPARPRRRSGGDGRLVVTGDMGRAA